MSPFVKYTLGRLGLAVAAFALLLPLPLNLLVKAMIAIAVSAIASYFLLADWRNQVAEQLGSAAARRTAEKERLRAALAGDEEAAAAGDRAAAGDPASAPAPASAEGDGDGDEAPAKAGRPADQHAEPAEEKH
jgi:uncharacterized protein DUF4229